MRSTLQALATPVALLRLYHHCYCVHLLDFEVLAAFHFNECVSG